MSSGPPFKAQKRARCFLCGTSIATGGGMWHIDARAPDHKVYGGPPEGPWSVSALNGTSTSRVVALQDRVPRGEHFGFLVHAACWEP